LADWATRWPAIFEKPTPLAIGFARQIHAKLKPQFTRKEIGVALHLRSAVTGDRRASLRTHASLA